MTADPKPKSSPEHEQHAEPDALEKHAEPKETPTPKRKRKSKSKHAENASRCGCLRSVFIMAMLFACGAVIFAFVPAKLSSPPPVHQPPTPEFLQHSSFSSSKPYLVSLEKADVIHMSEPTTNVAERNIQFSFNVENQNSISYPNVEIIVDYSDCNVEGIARLYSFPKLSLGLRETKTFKIQTPLPQDTTYRCASIIVTDGDNTILGSKNIDIPAHKYLFRLKAIKDFYPEGGRFLFTGHQGVAKTSVILSLIHLLAGTDTYMQHSPVGNINTGEMTTFKITDHNSEWAEGKSVKKLSDFAKWNLELVDTIGYYNDATLFTENFWIRLVKGWHPQDWDPVDNPNPHPSTFLNKSSNALILSARAQDIDGVNSAVMELGSVLDGASKKARVPLILMITMTNALNENGSYLLSAQESDKLLVNAKKSCPNVFVLMSYKETGDSNWQIDFHNLKTLHSILKGFPRINPSSSDQDLLKKITKESSPLSPDTPSNNDTPPAPAPPSPSTEPRSVPTEKLPYTPSPSAAP